MDIWHKTQYVHCAPNQSKLTLGSCRINQEQAQMGARALVSGESVNDVPEHQIERFVTCSGCGHLRIGLPVKEVYRRLKGEFVRVAEALENFDWYQHDNDVRMERIRRERQLRWQRQLSARKIG